MKYVGICYTSIIVRSVSIYKLDNKKIAQRFIVLAISHAIIVFLFFFELP